AAITALAVVIRKIINICKGKYLLEAEIEDMDPIFVFGKNIPPKIKALIDGKPEDTKKDQVSNAEIEDANEEGGAVK
ncbi:MAG: hypothetical protein Q4E99_02315, partial [Bacillota bacterium]|nr:hypothetical protein [Bacillota bacterium]